MECWELLHKIMFNDKVIGKGIIDFDDKDENVGYLEDPETGETFKIKISKEK